MNLAVSRDEKLFHLGPRKIARHWKSLEIPFARFILIAFWLSALGSLCMAQSWEPSVVVGMRYPLLPRMARITGLVVVRLSIGTEGSVESAETVAGHPLLSEVARKNAKAWKFQKSQAGLSASSDFYLVYRFLLKGSCVANDCHEVFSVEYPGLVTIQSEMPSIQITADGN